jgi:DnaJ homologue, subfamily C, member 28, conserved domain
VRRSASGRPRGGAAYDRVVSGARKPPRVPFESWVERKIREGMERGEFAGLPGAGQPIADIDDPRDELWWVRRKLRREEFVVLPPTLQIRKDRDAALEQVGAACSEEQVRVIVADVNRRIAAVNSTAITGPPSTVAKLDVEEVLDRWRAARQRPAGPATGAGPSGRQALFTE